MMHSTIAGETLHRPGMNVQQKLDHAIIEEYRAWAEIVPNLERVKEKVALLHTTTVKRVNDALRRYVDNM